MKQEIAQRKHELAQGVWIAYIARALSLSLLESVCVYCSCVYTYMYLIFAHDAEREQLERDRASALRRAQQIRTAVQHLFQSKEALDASRKMFDTQRYTFTYTYHDG